MAEQLTVLVADDHPVVRDGLKAALAVHRDITVIGTASTCPEAVEMSRAGNPRVVVLDLGMPGGTGVETIRRIRASNPATVVLAFSMSTDAGAIMGAMDAGASGFVAKGATHPTVVSAVRAVAQGNVVFDNGVAAVVAALMAKACTHQQDTRLLTLLFTDIVASTAHLFEVGDRRWRALMDQHDDIVRRTVDAQGGWYVKSTGDGCLAAFNRPGCAIAAAHGIMDEAERIGLSIRAGLHAGECQVSRQDVQGLAVHIAARVVGLAGARDVLVTRTVSDLLAGSGLVFEFAGEHVLAGLPGASTLLRCKTGRSAA